MKKFFLLLSFVCFSQLVFSQEEKVKVDTSKHSTDTKLLEEYSQEEDIEVDIDTTDHSTDTKPAKAYSQEEEIEEGCYCWSATSPEPVGGYSALYDYITRNMQIPPSQRFISGDFRVYVSMVIKKDGKVDNVQIIKGVNTALDEEALRLMKNSPIVWKGATLRGRLIEQRVALPIRFSLEAETPMLSESEILLYPNPCQDFLFVKTVYPNYKVQILDIFGKKMLSREQKNEESIDIREFPKGLYICRVSFENKTIEKTFLK